MSADKEHYTKTPLTLLASLDGRQGAMVRLVVGGRELVGTLMEGLNYDFFVRTNEGDVQIPLEGWEALQLRFLTGLEPPAPDSSGGATNKDHDNSVCRSQWLMGVLSSGPDKPVRVHEQLNPNPDSDED